MANSKRLLIRRNLLKREMNVIEPGERVGVGQSPLSQRLSKLRAWDFVKTRGEGQEVHYSLTSDAVQAVLATLYGHIAPISYRSIVNARPIRYLVRQHYRQP